jgi:thiol-disulfide isomerase/thioredoxin
MKANNPMSLRFIAVFILSFMLLQTVSAQDFKVKRYQPAEAELALRAALDSTDVFSDRLEIGRKFRDQFPDEVGVQIRVADLLAVDNTDAVRDHYKKYADSNPANTKAQFLAGRVAATPAERQQYVQNILTREPENYWGLLLKAASFAPEEDTDFKQSEAALREAIRIDNSLPYAVASLGDLLARTGRTEDADAVFERLSEMLPGDFEPVQQRLMLIPGKFTKHIELLNAYLKTNPKDILALDVRARVYRELGDWNGYIESMEQAVNAAHQPVDMYNLACGYSLTGRADDAFRSLFDAADAGFTDISVYQGDDDLLPLHDDNRWVVLLAKVEANRQKELLAIAAEQKRRMPEQKMEQLTERSQDALAPDFSGTTLDGKTFKLSELKGKIVVIDFWATWCGPCRKTMPLLDDFYKNKRGEDVVVFGINVWERNGTAGVKPFIEKSGYSFPIVLAANEVAQQYGVSGIPTMFVIDKEGKVAYKHVGYNPQIVSILSAQTAELSK